MSAAGSSPTFRRRAAPWLLAVGGISIAVTLLLALLGEDAAPRVSPRPDTSSKSAVGYGGLAHWLRAMGRSVIVSRSGTAAKAGIGTVVLLPEPWTRRARDRELLQATIDDCRNAGATTVVVLPKWKIYEDLGRPGWIAAAVLRPKSEVKEVLAQVMDRDPDELSGVIFRPEEPRFHPESVGAVPELPEPQLLDASIGSPWPSVAGDLAGLIVKVQAGVWVISDPDLLNNAGLGKGRNAVILDRFLQTLGAERIVIDEAIHGGSTAQSIWSELAGFPLIVVTLHCVGLLLLGVLSLAAGFGSADPLPRRVPVGKATLIGNTADLLTVAGHGAYSLSRYLDLVFASAAASCRLGTGLSRAERLKKLVEHSRRRGTGDDPAAIAGLAAQLEGNNPPNDRILAVAAAAHRWRDRFLRSAPKGGGDRWRWTKSGTSRKA